jgi:dihydroneopterin aldolase/2-amino-4-hydroxy-6-hydroxymethyldihydropteridine diphosphokinase
VSTRAFIAVGSNLDPEHNVTAALGLLGRLLRIAGVSDFYRTPALGSAAGPDFLNGVVEIDTELEPHDLKRLVLLEVENSLGRERGADRDAPRTIDLDLVLYGDLVSNEEGLVLPAPEILERAFIAFPLLELEPDLVLPGTDRPLSELAAGLSSSQMVPADSLNARLRREESSREEDT